jgi:hypothetical protein
VERCSPNRGAPLLPYRLFTDTRETKGILSSKNGRLVIFYHKKTDNRDKVIIFLLTFAALIPNVSTENE